MDKANTPKPSDLIFTDPETYTEVVEENAVNKAVAIFDKREAVRNAWNGFYSSHPDLRGHEEFVEFHYEKLKKLHPDLPADQALVKLGSEVRTHFNKVRDNHQGGKVLSADPAVVAGTSNGGAPTTQGTQTVQEESFISQVRKFQRRGK